MTDPDFGDPENCVPVRSLADQQQRALDFISWLRALGGLWHQDLEVKADDDWGGIAPFASSDIPPDTTVIAIPHHLVVTRETSIRGIATACGLDVDNEKDMRTARRMFGGLQERQGLGAYVLLHWMMEDGVLDPEGRETSQLHHLPYIRSLPLIGTVLTPTFWTESERDLIAGSNLAHAERDRRDLWRKEYDELVLVLTKKWRDDGSDDESDSSPDTKSTFSSSPEPQSKPQRQRIGIPPNILRQSFTWPRYLQSQTYISSRAFPSTLLDKFAQLNPTSIMTDADEGTYPVLLPGVDMLNHRRGEKVTWGSRRVAGNKKAEKVVETFIGDAIESNCGDGDGSTQATAEAQPQAESREQELVVLVVYDGRKRGEQVFNNYGLKGNEEMVLGYGFAIDPNPDDNCALKLGSADTLPVGLQGTLRSSGLDFGRLYFVGRDGELPDQLWRCIRLVVGATGEEGEEPMDEDEIELAAAEQLEGMISAKAAGLRGKVESLKNEEVTKGCRPIVLNMIRLYFQAQVEILATCRSELRKKMNELEIKLYGEEGEVAMRDSD